MEFFFHDLETTPLQIKTDSVVGSGEEVALRFYTADGESAGSIILRFSDPPPRLPSEQSKIWTFTETATETATETTMETATEVRITCNEAEVVTYSVYPSGNLYSNMGK